jgi:polyisoprenoid-binding protein YceI
MKQIRIQLHKLAFLTALGLFIAGGAVAAEALPAWKIDTPASSLTFNTTKAGAAGVGGLTETMRFNLFNGGLDSHGHVEMNIDLASIDSGIELRNERLKTMFWDVVSHPIVTFSAQLNPSELQKINSAKESMALELDGKLTMTGEARIIKAHLQVTPVGGNRLIVSTRQAIVINASDFGLITGVEALRTVMGLNFLSSSVPVIFSLELKKSSP